MWDEHKERVNLLLHQIAERSVHQAVPRHPLLADKLRRNNVQVVVTTARSRARMPGVGGAVVGQCECFGRERRAQPRLHVFDAAHGDLASAALATTGSGLACSGNSSMCL